MQRSISLALLPLKLARLSHPKCGVLATGGSYRPRPGKPIIELLQTSKRSIRPRAPQSSRALVTIGANVGVTKNISTQNNKFLSRLELGKWRESADASSNSQPGARLRDRPEGRPIWRRGWDSNPRYPCRYAAFRVRCIRPLCHLSAVRSAPFERGAVNSGCRAGLQGGQATESSSICHGDGNPLDSFHRLTYCARCSGIGLTCAATLVLCAVRPCLLQASGLATNHLSRRCANASPSPRLIKRRPCPFGTKSRHEHERIKYVRSHQDRR
jgi:hypothetical protein